MADDVIEPEDEFVDDDFDDDDDDDGDDFVEDDDAEDATGDAIERSRGQQPSVFGNSIRGNLRRGRGRSHYRDLIREAGGIDYKNTDLLTHFITDRGKIRPRRQTNVSAKEQRDVARAIKRARIMALLPYNDEHVRELM